MLQKGLHGTRTKISKLWFLTHCKSIIDNAYFENCALLQNIGCSYETPFKEELELAYLLQSYKKKEHIQSSIQSILYTI